MHSEPAASPWAVELAPDLARPTPPSSASTSVPSAAAPVTPARRHLSLITGGADVERVESNTTTPPIARSQANIVVPPMAEPPTAVASALWATPTAVLDLLSTASEHRRALDLVRTACEIGAIQLPPALVEVLDRARATWPATLPCS